MTSLTKKVQLTIAVTTVCMLVIFFLFSYGLIIRGALSLENARMKKDLKITLQAIDSLKIRAVRVCRYYAAWDLTYEYMDTRSPAYNKANFTNFAFENHPLNFIIILDDLGNIVYSSSYDFKSHSSGDAIPPEILAELKPGGILLSNTIPYKPVTGFLNTDQGIVVVAAHPILTSNLQGPAKGTIVVGTYVSEDIIQEFNKQTGLSVEISGIDYTDHNFQATFNSLSSNGGVLIKPNNENLLEGYMIIPDLNDSPLLLKLQGPRDLYNPAKNAIFYITVMIISLGLILSSLLRHYIMSLVLQPLGQINREVEKVGTEQNLAQRIPLLGKYEMASLTSAINGMLNDLENSQKELIESEKRYKILSYHDPLTGLYNRTFFEVIIEDISRNMEKHQSLSIIVADIDGLKLVNDTVGHQEGDTLLRVTAELLSQSVQGEDILARIGGDEFCLILPHIDKLEAERRREEILEKFRVYNETASLFPISISLGVATAENSTKSCQELFKQADDAMYNYKLSQSGSPKSQIIDILLAALSERDFIAQGHVERLVFMAERMAEKLNLPDETRRNLILLAKVHDLGKVGIPDEILFKPTKLTSDEYAKMKEHSRIGFSIANRSKELSHIAGLILSHHEYWNGQGYPIGLKEEGIPLECRILAILDAFDAMTNDRPYHTGISYEVARTELLRCSGTQFEPRLVTEFLKLLDEEQENLVS